MPDANATATMDNSNGHGWRRWAVAVGAVLIACLARAVLWPDLFREATFMPLFGAVLLSAWYGGLGPGLLAVALGAAFMAWTIFPPLENFAVSDPRSQLGMALYLAFGTGICLACHSLHASRRRQRVVQAALHEVKLREAMTVAETAQLAAEAQRKDRFLATLAHELRNPLAPVRYAVEIARRNPAYASDALATIDRQVDHLSRLVEDLMDVSRIARDRLELRTGIVRAEDVLAVSLETARPVIEGAGHRLDIVEPDRRWALEGDLVRVAQAITNLLNNAAKFTPPGGIIQVEVTADDATLSFTVTDNGVGIDPGDIERLMQPFEQGVPPPHMAPSGLGIGLALSRQIAQLHGGSLVLERGPDGTGTRATLRLPRARDVAPAVAPVLPARSTEAISVLVADDNADAATTLRLMLELEGHTVHVASDGEEACQLAEAVRPAAAFIDLGMPRRDGLQVCGWIRGRPWSRRTRLIALTGWGQASDFERTRRAGFDAHLVKPVDSGTIMRALRGEDRSAAN